MRRTLAVVVLSSSMSSAAGRAQEGPAPVPKEPPAQTEAPAPPADARAGDADVAARQEALKAFVGRWRCEGTASTERAADAPVSTTLKIDAGLGKSWLRATSEEKRTKDNPAPRRSEELFGYDAGSGTYRRAVVVDDGQFLVGRSEGLLGDRLDWVLEGEKGGAPVRFKETWTKKADRALTVTRAVSVGEGEWRVVYEAACTK